MDFTDISEETWSNWERKRRNTLIGYLIVATLVGIDYMFMFTTLYLYLKDMIKVEQPTLYYGIIIAVYNLSSIFFGTFCGRWIDKTRKIKLCTTVMLILQIIGCVLYVIHFNVAFPLIGRLIGGLGDPFPSVVSGEIIRIYDREGSTRALWWLASAYSVAAMVSPFIVLFFKNVDFHIGSIHLTQLNIIGIFMAALLITALIVVQFLIHDCSAEIDLKDFLKREEEEDEKCLTDVKNSSQQIFNVSEKATEETSLLGCPGDVPTIPIKVIFKGLYNNVDAILMLTSTFAFVYNVFACDVIFPLVTVIILQWSLTSLSYLILGSGVLYFIALMVMSKFCVSDLAVYIMSLVCIVTQIFTFVSLIFIKILPRDLKRDIILMILAVVFLVFAWMIEEVLIKCMLAKMVPSTIQSFTETLRNGVSRSSTVIASITAPLIIPYLHYWSGGLLVGICVLLLVFITRRKYLMNIKELHFGTTDTMEVSGI